MNCINLTFAIQFTSLTSGKMLATASSSFLSLNGRFLRLCYKIMNVSYHQTTLKLATIRHSRMGRIEIVTPAK